MVCLFDVFIFGNPIPRGVGGTPDNLLFIYLFIFFLFFHTTITFIIQHIDTLPKYGKKKLSMYVGPHDVYPTLDVNFNILTIKRMQK